MRRTLLVYLLAILPFSALAHEGATGVVKDRMDGFKASQSHVKAIAKSIKQKDLKAVIDPAEKIALWADQMVEYFPEGSNKKPSEARDNIWTEFDIFTEQASANGMAARRLATIAKTGNVDQAQAAFKEVIGTCKSCHQRFRK